MLRKGDKDWIEFQRDKWKKDPDRRGSIKYKDQGIRKRAVKALNDLAYLAEKLDPSQHRQIFTQDNILPIISALSKFVDNEKSKDNLSDCNEVVYNRRVFLILIRIAQWSINYASGLITKEFRDLITIRGEHLLIDERFLDLINIAYHRTV